MLAIEWKPEEWHDTYEEQVRKLVEDKLAGREIAVSAGPAPEATNRVDLMDALRRSLDSARETEPAKGTKKPSGRTAAARASRTPKPTGGKTSTSVRAPVGRTAAKLGTLERHSFWPEKKLTVALRRAESMHNWLYSKRLKRRRPAPPVVVRPLPEQTALAEAFIAFLDHVARQRVAVVQPAPCRHAHRIRARPTSRTK
ncbi:hypothetical protein [Kitasatospora sp. NPDC056181]|uniref:hypothetical protein n=1 Tax=Kitasatospora sp. NPDC056181 TaxID=3345737 RepID=UPI0035E01FE1